MQVGTVHHSQPLAGNKQHSPCNQRNHPPKSSGSFCHEHLRFVTSVQTNRLCGHLEPFLAVRPFINWHSTGGRRKFFTQNTSKKEWTMFNLNLTINSSPKKKKKRTTELKRTGVGCMNTQKRANVRLRNKLCCPQHLQNQNNASN